MFFASHAPVSHKIRQTQARRHFGTKKTAKQFHGFIIGTISIRQQKHAGVLEEERERERERERENK